MKSSLLKYLILLSMLTFLMGCKDPKKSDPYIEVTGMSLKEGNITMNVGEVYQLTLELQPQNATPPSAVIWQSSNERVVTVNESGELEAIAYGKATITASYRALSATCEVQVNESERTYKLVWSDEFDKPEIDVTKWNHETGGGGWGNQEVQYYTNRADNSYIEDGCLVIEAKKESYGNREYTSARLTTKDKMFTTYGKMEARISVPAGRGTWSAFWMMPQKNVYGVWPRSGELDIMEHVGSDPRMTSHALHTQKAYGGRSWTYRVYNDNMEENFHTYSIEWVNDYYNGNDAIMFYVDGKLSVIKDQPGTSTNADWPFDIDYFIILNLAMGGTWGGTIDDSIFNSPVRMKVDYVRVYELEK